MTPESKDSILNGLTKIILFLWNMLKTTGFTAIPVYILFNAVAVDAFKLPPINLVQAWGLVILCGLLFKSNQSITILNVEEKSSGV